jgi:hypothetical protein
MEQLIHVNTSELRAFRIATAGSNWALLAGWLAGWQHPLCVTHTHTISYVLEMRCLISIANQWDGSGFIQDDENAVGGKRGFVHVIMLQFYAYML